MNQHIQHTDQSSGFTLIEMMVALFIFAMLSVAGILLLRSAVDGNEVTANKLGNMAEMQRFVSLMETDLNQALPRPYRNEDGIRKPAFEGGTGGRDDFLLFTSGGQSNLNDKPRSNLRRISYRVTDGILERRQYEMTDGGKVSDPAELLKDVENLQLRFRNKSGLWSRDWKVAKVNDIPRALEISFEQAGRSYRHLFLVGAGYL